MIEEEPLFYDLIARSSHRSFEETNSVKLKQFAVEHPELKLIDGYFYYFGKDSGFGRVNKKLPIWSAAEYLLCEDGLLNAFSRGNPIFSFDKEKVFYYFKDYPDALTSEQKAIFDKAFPRWANF